MSADSENETVWLTQEEMARLFGVDRTRIIHHIQNIYADNELDKVSTCAENAQVQKGSKNDYNHYGRKSPRRNGDCSKTSDDLLV